MNGGYASDLSDFILDECQNVTHWIHGHTHTMRDYYVGETNVVSNPRGYVGHDSHLTNFDPALYFEV